MSHNEEWRKQWKKPNFHRKTQHMYETEWGWIVFHPENLKLGRFTDIGFGVLIHAGVGVTLEDYVEVGAGTKIFSVNSIDNVKGKVIIKKRAKVGANSVILPNVVIGENSKVGALSLVNSGTVIPANEVWVGIPAHRKFLLL